MKEVTTIGLDLAKNVFQVHGVDGSGKTVIRRRLRRSQMIAFFKKLPPCDGRGCGTGNFQVKSQSSDFRDRQWAAGRLWPPKLAT